MRARIALLILLLVLTSAIAEAAHVWPQTDYSPKSRVGLEVAFGHMNEPVPADYLHYLFNLDFSVIENLHLRLGIPFSGYSGAYGKDNFIRGNILLGASYMYPVTPWLHVGGGLRLFTPTYESADPPSTGLMVDPRRALLTHWQYRFQYAMEDYFPISPEIGLRMMRWNVFTQWDFGFTYAFEVDENERYNREYHMWMLHYAFALGYDFWGYAELCVSLAGIADPESDGKHMRSLTGNPLYTERNMHVVSIGPRGQYKWAVFFFEASFPLEKAYREVLDPYYHFTFQVEFP